MDKEHLQSKEKGEKIRGPIPMFRELGEEARRGAAEAARRILGKMNSEGDLLPPESYPEETDQVVDDETKSSDKNIERTRDPIAHGIAKKSQDMIKKLEQNGFLKYARRTDSSEAKNKES